MKLAVRHAVVAPLLLAACAAFAAGGETPRAASVVADPDVAAARAAIKAGDWNAAGDALRKAIARDPRNADYHNLYAYSIRKGANASMDLVFKHYSEALRLDPKHRGAHEYIGEAYLMVGNLAKANEHLSTLDALCGRSCDEYSDLKQAIAEHEAKQKR